jgi:hypothetical protein
MELPEIDDVYQLHLTYFYNTSRIGKNQNEKPDIVWQQMCEIMMDLQEALNKIIQEHPNDNNIINSGKEIISKSSAEAQRAFREDFPEADPDISSIM